MFWKVIARTEILLHLNVLFDTGLCHTLGDCYHSSLCLPPANTKNLLKCIEIYGHWQVP